MARELTIYWQKQVERPGWDAVKSNPSRRYIESKDGLLVGTCDHSGLLIPFIQGVPKPDNITRFDILCPANWKNNRIIFNDRNMGTLGFYVIPDPEDYRSVAPSNIDGGFIRIGRVQCPSDSEWITDMTLLSDSKSQIVLHAMRHWTGKVKRRGKYAGAPNRKDLIEAIGFDLSKDQRNALWMKSKG